jgi:hypothetical protein
MHGLILYRENCARVAKISSTLEPDGKIKTEGRIKVLRKRVDFSFLLKSPVQEKGIPFRVADTALTADFLGQFDQYRPGGSS